MLATSAKSYKTHFIRFVFDKTKLVPCFCGIFGHLKAFLAMLDLILLIFGPKLALYIYIGNTVPAITRPHVLARHFMAELEARGPLIGKILSIGIR